jgi:hypothetical protein
MQVVHVKRVWPVPPGMGTSGLFAYASALLGSIFRPRPHLRHALARLKVGSPRIRAPACCWASWLRACALHQARIGFAHPIVGVHVRYGDGCLPNQVTACPGLCSAGSL